MIDTHTNNIRLPGEDNNINCSASMLIDVHYFPVIEEIIPDVYLGNHATIEASNFTFLIEKGIRHVLCVSGEIQSSILNPENSGPRITCLRVDFRDKETENILKLIPQTNDFIARALLKKSKVLVCCDNGSTRSGALVVAYVMEKFQMSFNEAFQLVKTKREIHLNPGFEAQLNEFEPIYKAMQRFSYGESSSRSSINTKRKYENDYKDIGCEPAVPESFSENCYPPIRNPFIRIQVAER
ncbi:hypothetical protein ABEB36_004989 [Hypothenemus hampei]|uniref:Protein-tyrosine-phosphatase n=1 Tax=Hypothenemus hampei TaxID=57062 RepID=A0ABD1EZL3_HYPHA